MTKEFNNIILSAFLALCGGCILYMSLQISGISTSIRELTESVGRLNGTMAVVVKEGELRTQILKDHEGRIRYLEKQR